MEGLHIMIDSQQTEDTQAPTQRSSGGLTEDIRGVMADIERRLDRLKVAHADRERERQDLENRNADVEARAASLAEEAAALERGQQAHEEAVAAAQSRFEELDRREVAAREAFEQAKARHDETRRELGVERENVERERKALTEAQEDFELEKDRVREIAAEATQHLKDIEDDREALAKTSVELDERQKDLDSQASTLAERLKELEQQRAGLDERAAQLDEQDRKLAELSREAAEQREQLSGDSSDLEQQKRWLAEQTAQVDLLRARVAQLETELAEAREAAEAAPVSGDAHIADEAVAHELEVTKEKLRDAATIIGELREKLDRAKQNTSGDAGASDDEHLARRKRRLDYVRGALREQQDKLAQASALLRERTASMAASPKARPSRAAKVGVVGGIARLGMGTAGISFALAILAGVSWLAAGEIATPTYVASVTVAHDARGRDVLAEDLTGWQRFHEELMVDPRFYEFASERMRQRGLLGLGDAVAVKNFVEDEVSWVSGRDGELKLEVRQQGADRAERVAE
ncbi:MAG: hypothetical protein HRU13_02985, partial [Phycisphaerales bacterium]|nr:hypothetical protein [Phycisphaerales bacterium]